MVLAVGGSGRGIRESFGAGVNFAGRGGILSPGGPLWFARLFLGFGSERVLQ